MRIVALADGIGVAMLAAVAALPLGCGVRPIEAKDDLQPLIAVAGNYSVLVSGKNPSPAPAPAPKPNGCRAGCRCNGTGIEPTGDGLAKVPCRCDDDCPCKTKATPCPNGKCLTGSTAR
jgi:hypothetical protein